jgi:hypothetical protein
MAKERLRHFSLGNEIGPVEKPPVPRRATLIALGFNRTFTADRRLWVAMIVSAVRVGHKVIMITTRNETPKNMQKIRAALGPYVNHVSAILFTNGAPKRQYAQLQGYKVDIWIDDVPEVITATCHHAVREAEKQFPSEEPIPITAEL